MPLILSLLHQNTDIVYFDEAVKGLEAQLKDLEKAQKFIFMEYHAIADAEAWHKIQEDVYKRQLFLQLHYRNSYNFHQQPPVNRSTDLNVTAK